MGHRRGCPGGSHGGEHRERVGLNGGQGVVELDEREGEVLGGDERGLWPALGTAD